MARRKSSPLLQCRGPDRRLTRWQLLIAILIVVGFVGGAALFPL